MLPLLVAALAMTSSCSRLRSGDVLEQRAEIVFVNESLDQADVYAISSSSETLRIGTVMPGTTETLRLPSTITDLGPVNIVARVLSRAYAPTSGPISLGAGSRYQIRLPMDERVLTVLPASP